MSAFAELRRYLASWAADLRGQHDFDAVLEVECVQEIAAEARAVVQQVRELAHKAEVHDLEAAKLLEHALVDGLDQSDVPTVRRALAMLKRSADADHRITEVTHA